jgi:hypothetical protein
VHTFSLRDGRPDNLTSRRKRNRYLTDQHNRFVRPENEQEPVQGALSRNQGSLAEDICPHHKLEASLVTQAKQVARAPAEGTKSGLRWKIQIHAEGKTKSKS